MTQAEFNAAVWSTEIQPGLTARQILAAWLRFAADGIRSGVGSDDIEAWFAAGRKAAARFAPDTTQIRKIAEAVVLGTTDAPGITPRASRAPLSDEHDEFDLIALLLLV